MNPYDACVAAIKEENPSHVFALFSGGHDSLCATHVASTLPHFTGVAHIDTGTGIPATTEFVRRVCRTRGWPLLELRPDGKTYEQLVMEKGFPYGLKSHNTMYYWLKQRQVRRLVREHKQNRKDRIGLVTGVRVNESVRRMGRGISVPVRREGAQLWLNPILEWDEHDKNAYMEQHELPRNMVVDLLHRSGECLCGALARREEMRDLIDWYPEIAAGIQDLERRAEAAGHRECRWASKMRSDADVERVLADPMPLCATCEARYE